MSRCVYLRINEELHASRVMALAIPLRTAYSSTSPICSGFISGQRQL